MLQVIRGIFQDNEDTETRVSLIYANKSEIDICRNFFCIVPFCFLNFRRSQYAAKRLKSSLNQPVIVTIYIIPWVST